MKIMVVDGQGGGIGRAIIETIRKYQMDVFVLGVGTNVVASQAMKKAGADVIATGENPIVYNTTQVDYIMGPIGIVFGNSMYGEISETMANAISNCGKPVYLVPVNKCVGHIACTGNQSIGEYVDDLVLSLKAKIEEE